VNGSYPRDTWNSIGNIIVQPESVSEIHFLKFYQDWCVCLDSHNSHVRLVLADLEQTHSVFVFIIYPSMYCSKYRMYRAVEYKLADCISVSPQCDFQNPYHACLTCKLQWYAETIFVRRKYFELKQPRLSPFWYVNWFRHVYTFNLLKKNAKQHRVFSGIFNKCSIINNPSATNTA